MTPAHEINNCCQNKLLASPFDSTVHWYVQVFDFRSTNYFPNKTLGYILMISLVSRGYEYKLKESH